MTSFLQTESPIVGSIDRLEGAIAQVRLDDGSVCACARLRSCGMLRPGDRVLVYAGLGIVLGAIADGPPDELVIEAGRSLVIRCGLGSIQIRQDGRILIEGLDIVSKAARANRVKGAQVVIN